MKLKTLITKHQLISVNILLFIILSIGFVIVVYNDSSSYQLLVNKQLMNIVNLADLNTSKSIENSMSEPLTVSMTMANDTFLVNWLENEDTSNQVAMDELVSYLKAYQEKYNYTTVFCISNESGKYYYQDGLNKTISLEDEHDIWYYNFISSGSEYDIQLDSNETINNIATLFVNFRIEDEQGNLLGVVGVGFRYTLLEKMVQSYEDDYGLSIYIINEKSAANSYTETNDIFIEKEDLNEVTSVSEPIELNTKDEGLIQWFVNNGTQKCIITRYNYDLGWYIIIEKEIDSLAMQFKARIIGNIVFMLLTLLACYLVTAGIFKAHNKKLITNENIDDLTGIYNRKLFTLKYKEYISLYKEEALTLFLFDLDNFKQMNDVKGHLYGNDVLSYVGSSLKMLMKGKGIVSRWGGDEFVGILKADLLSSEQILHQLMDLLAEDHSTADLSISEMEITLSVGIVPVYQNSDLNELILQADHAMYLSKGKGKNQITRG